jgi:hypothetical protein
MITLLPQYQESALTLGGACISAHRGALTADLAPWNMLPQHNQSKRRVIFLVELHFIVKVSSEFTINCDAGLWPLVQQQAAPVLPTVDPETTVSRPKTKCPAVPPRVMAKTIKPLIDFVRRNSAALAQYLLVVHG